MAVKKADTKEQVAKEKESTKKAAEKPVVKAEKSAKSEKSEKPEKTEKSEKKGGKSALVTYQPEFTKSVLDQPEASAGPVYRYSDADLQEFRELIQKKLESAKKELIYLQGLITRKDEAGTDDTENKYMSMEDGSGSQEREQLNQMASRQIQFIDHLEKAMMRIENKTYGICRVTGKLIDKARLRAVPHATLSIEAKLAKSK
ncbi:TraR/DksA C4-type zinc finger protein [Chitinophaga solisilvae]|nr:TraR/DksA C4-type zinc finger protein [Chitinophaga solisilvae]